MRCGVMRRNSASSPPKGRGDQWPHQRPDRWQHPIYAPFIPEDSPCVCGGVHRCCKLCGCCGWGKMVKSASFIKARNASASASIASASSRRAPSLRIAVRGSSTSSGFRKGRMVVFIVMAELPKGKVIGRCMQRYRRQEFIRFFNAVEREVPAGKAVSITAGSSSKVIQLLEYGVPSAGGTDFRQPLDSFAVDLRFGVEEYANWHRD
jgi:hypothetical protein